MQLSSTNELIKRNIWNYKRHTWDQNFQAYFQFLYSNVVSLASDINFNLTVSNPFAGLIKLQTTTLQKGTLETELYDSWGKLISTKNFSVDKGLNKNLIDGLQNTAAGFYFLLLKLDGRSTEKKLIKAH